VADSTAMNGDALRAAATSFENLVTDERKKVFRDLVDMPMQAGNIDAGIWLQDRCYDRRAGMRQHVDDLDDVFKALAEKLRTIADKVSETDQTNGDNLQTTAVEAINDWITALKNAERAKPTFERDDYNNPDDRATPTDQNSTYTDKGHDASGYHYDVQANGPFTGPDYEADVYNGMKDGHPDFEPGITVAPDVTVTDTEQAAHGGPTESSQRTPGF
jgi:hypothetical protein